MTRSDGLASALMMLAAISACLGTFGASIIVGACLWSLGYVPPRAVILAIPLGVVSGILAGALVGHVVGASLDR